MIKKTSRFWPLQFSCWLIVALINYATQRFYAGFPLLIASMNALGLGGGGLLVTSLYRTYIKRRYPGFRMKRASLAVNLIIGTLMGAICWLLLIYLLFLPIHQRFPVSVGQVLINIAPIGVLLLCWNLVYTGYQLLRQYHRSEVAQWKLEATVRQASLGMLRSQLNPHFIFNTLNNIRSLVLADPEQARRMITDFSELFRYTLQYTEEKEVLLSDELRVLQQYIDLVKLQYEDKLEFQLVVEPAVADARLPPMILQLLVENAIKHGVALSPDGGAVKVHIKENINQLALYVSNSGNLNRKNELEETTGVGLRNIKERLQLLYGEKAVLKLEEMDAEVVVSIMISRT